ncbi:MAG: hypothetical protein ACTSWY_06945 [Promethearchaeota archaeon]
MMESNNPGNNGSSVRVIHVIGLVGAGKTYFIQRHFPQTALVFDIKVVYELNQFSPGDLYNNPAAYERFTITLQSEFNLFLERAEKAGHNYIIAESTGTNSAMNKTFRKYREYCIWIEADNRRMQSQYLREMPYAGELNKYLRKRWMKNEIYTHNIYDPKFEEFENNLPEDVAMILVL